MAQPIGQEKLDPVARPPVEITAYLVKQRSAAVQRHWLLRVGRDTYVWAAVALVLGLFFTAQLQSKPAPPVDVDYPRQVGASTIQQLEADQAALKKQIADLRRQITLQQEEAARQKASFAEIGEALKQEQIIAGLTPLAGPGLRITLDDSPVKTVPAGQDPDNYLVHEIFLRDVINILWASGAEAISLNGERIVATTSVYCAGSTILVNSTRLSPPYVFLVIGDPAKLMAGLNDPAALPLLKYRVQNFGVQFEVKQEAEVKVPAFNGTMQIRYAQPGEAKKG